MKLTTLTVEGGASAPSRPLPILYNLGENDPLVPFAGGVINGNRGTALSAADSLTTWTTFSDC